MRERCHRHAGVGGVSRDYAAQHGITYPAGQMPPVQPKPLPGPAMIFGLTSYGGPAQILHPGKYDTSDGTFTLANDSVQSVQVSAGLVVRLYEHFHFQGEMLDVRENTADLGTWDDKASSAIVYKDGDPAPRTTIVVLIQLADKDTWDGPFWVYAADDNGMQAEPQMTIRSALIPVGMVVSLFSAPGFNGTRTDYTSDTADLGDNEPGAYSFIVWDQQVGMPVYLTVQ